MPLHPYIKRAHIVEASWPVPKLCQHYHWPTELKGGGVIAIVELGGGWLQSDVAMFCQNYSVAMPSIIDISVDGKTKNSPGPDPDSDGEVALDIQVAAAAYFMATGKPADIRMYWGSDIAACVTAAAKDGCDVCSISWGADEAEWGDEALQAMQAAGEYATGRGMVVFAAAGDNDSGDGGPTPANVDAPASCPSIIGVGGTRYPTSGQVESVWNENPGQSNGEGTGGGYSTHFTPMLPWQIGAPHGPGRMVPDIAANADPVTGYEVIIAGQMEVIGGTSAAAPLYAGLFAAFGGKLGFITPKLYKAPLAFNDITLGDNGTYRALVGPDPCTGLGTPNGTRLAALFVKGDTPPA